MSAKRMPDLGRLELCLKVKDVKRSMKFYRALGFRKKRRPGKR